jgi:hypothetical protein
LQSQLIDVRDALARGEVRDADGRLLKDRLTEIEQELRQTPALTDQSRAEIDAAASQRARMQAEFIAVESLADRCDSALKDLDQTLENWRRDYLPILDDDRGRKIAADAKAVAQLVTLFEGSFPEERDAHTWRLELEAVTQPIRDAAKQGSEYRVSPEDRVFLESFLTRVDAANRQLRTRKRTMDRLLLDADRQAPAEVTLRDALETHDQQLLIEFATAATEKRVEALRRTVEEQSAAIQQAEEERIAAATRVRVAEIEAARAGLMERKQDIDQQVADARAAAERRQLEADYRRDEAEIKTLLTPFLADSESQPSLGKPDEPRSWIVPGVPFGPTSYGRLLGSGALEETAEGTRRLYYVGGYQLNFRPKGGFPQYSATGLNNDGIAQRVARARELLKKYGPLLVEKGMLQK